VIRSKPVEGWAKVKKAAEYAGVSERTFRDWLKNGLKHIRLSSGAVLIKYDSIDDYLERFEVNENLVDKIVDSVVSIRTPALCYGGVYERNLPSCSQPLL
jgi:excisionase family DNA binding protein